jgi:hypothetical protein
MPSIRELLRAAVIAIGAHPILALQPDHQHPDVYDERSVYCHTLDALRYYFVNRPRVRQEFHEVHHEYRSPFPWPVPGDGNAVLPYDQPRPLQQRSGPIW